MQLRSFVLTSLVVLPATAAPLMVDNSDATKMHVLTPDELFKPDDHETALPLGFPGLRAGEEGMLTPTIPYLADKPPKRGDQTALSLDLPGRRAGDLGTLKPAIPDIPDSPPKPDEPKPDKPKQDEPKPDEPKPDEPKPDDTTSLTLDMAKLRAGDQGTLKPAILQSRDAPPKPDEPKPDEPKPDDKNKPDGEGKPDDITKPLLPKVGHLQRLSPFDWSLPDQPGMPFNGEMTADVVRPVTADMLAGNLTPDKLTAPTHSFCTGFGVGDRVPGCDGSKKGAVSV